MPDSEVIPWERRRELGLVQAFIQTLVMSVREPRRFYALVPSDASPWPAIVYGLSFELVIAILSFVYTKLVGEAEVAATLAPFMPDLRAAMPEAPELIERLTGISAVSSLVLAPVSYLVELFGTAAMTWVGLRLTKNLNTSFGVILRLCAYATWVNGFGLLGITGNVVLSTLAFLLTLGFGSWAWLVLVRESQRVDTTQAVYASLLGGLVAIGVGCVIGVPLLAVLVVWVVSKVNLPTITP